MEDECSIGNDETRIFILSSFASKKMNRVPCVTCNALMLIYDRYAKTHLVGHATFLVITM